MQLKPTSKCPCTSGKIYRDCCKPWHRALGLGAGPEAMMRSRYCGFSIGLVDYLIATLHPNHADAKLDPAALRVAMTASVRSFRYPGLDVLSIEEGESVSHVTFRARLFEQRIDRTFIERSRFERHVDEAGGARWLYVAAESVEPQNKDALAP